MARQSATAPESEENDSSTLSSGSTSRGTAPLPARAKSPGNTVSSSHTSNSSKPGVSEMYSSKSSMAEDTLTGMEPNSRVGSVITIGKSTSTNASADGNSNDSVLTHKVDSPKGWEHYLVQSKEAVELDLEHASLQATSDEDSDVATENELMSDADPGCEEEHSNTHNSVVNDVGGSKGGRNFVRATEIPDADNGTNSDVTQGLRQADRSSKEKKGSGKKM